MKKLRNFKLFESNDYDDLYVIMMIEPKLISFVILTDTFAQCQTRIEDLSTHISDILIFYNEQKAISFRDRFKVFKNMEVKKLSYIKSLI